MQVLLTAPPVVIADNEYTGLLLDPTIREIDFWPENGIKKLLAKQF